MSKHPVYHKQRILGTNVRVVYRPHSRWFVQELSSTPPSREHDPWEDIGLAKATQAEAVAEMYRRYPVKEG